MGIAWIGVACACVRACVRVRACKYSPAELPAYKQRTRTHVRTHLVQVGDASQPGSQLTLSYVVVALLIVVGFLLIWIPIYLIVMVRC